MTEITDLEAELGFRKGTFVVILVIAAALAVIVFLASFIVWVSVVVAVVIALTPINNLGRLRGIRDMGGLPSLRRG